MISNAFKSAYINQVGQQTQGINTITSGVKDVGTIILGAMGFAGGFGESTMGKLTAAGAEHALAGRIGGIGGNLMLATLQQKQETAKAASQVSEAIKVDQSQQVKTAQTVYDTLINKKGNIQTSLGEIDPKSALGKKIKEQVEENDSNDR